MPLDTLDCLKTTVRNISGVRRRLGFIPPHGRTLAAGAEVSVPGDLVAAIIANSRDMPAASAQLKALERALTTDAIIDVVKTPAVILTSPNGLVRKQLGLSNAGALTADVTCIDTQSESLH